ncbi:hypothetical protein [Aquimarina brevivitae]|uniref:Uncharacterized protein n=1 Tax=Aquimarina brevivitae TaxID=323412 RepID=A0A4Q7PL74_9FLAO|nr:hypothetical protein [Aquimarina brevivitae]RZS99712.1 hypothetical protein EV197_0936 [Aquimarina brevivitae]
MEANVQLNNEILIKILQFIEEIQIPVYLSKITQSTFLPGILIKNGALHLDLEQLKYPGDVLHEAGHIAVTEADKRSSLHDNVTLDDPQKEGEEFAVLFWSYAAATHIGIPVEAVFHADGYKGDSQWLITQFKQGNYLGLPLLQWMGLTDSETNNITLPKMKKWLRA